MRSGRPRQYSWTASQPVLTEPGIQAFTVADDRLFVGLYETLLVFDVGE
jgi:hypothetical protein